MTFGTPAATHQARVQDDAPLRRVLLEPQTATAWSTIRVVFTDDEAIVTGDAYDWIFRWPGATGIAAEIPRFNETYIRGKLVAASTLSKTEVYDLEATVKNLETYYGEAENWAAIEAAARGAYDQGEAIEALDAELGDPADAYDIVAVKPSAQLQVAVHAVQMAAAHLQRKETTEVEA